MREKPKHYCGRKITDEVISRAAAIEKTYKEEGFANEMSSVNNLDELCALDETTPEKENIILGEDWYISYVVDDFIVISSLVATKDPKNTLVRTAEMLSAIKKILLLSVKKGNSIMCYMRHNTSYPFYRMFLEKGYFDELDDTIYLDYNRPSEMDWVIEDLKNKYATSPDENIEESIEENIVFIDNSDVEAYPCYGQYFFHDVEFVLTKKFINKYRKNEKK